MARICFLEPMVRELCEGERSSVCMVGEVVSCGEDRVGGGACSDF